MQSFQMLSLLPFEADVVCNSNKTKENHFKTQQLGNYLEFSMNLPVQIILGVVSLVLNKIRIVCLSTILSL